MLDITFGKIALYSYPKLINLNFLYKNKKISYYLNLPKLLFVILFLKKFNNLFLSV